MEKRSIAGEAVKCVITRLPCPTWKMAKEKDWAIANSILPLEDCTSKVLIPVAEEHPCALGFVHLASRIPLLATPASSNAQLRPAPKGSRPNAPWRIGPRERTQCLRKSHVWSAADANGNYKEKKKKSARRGTNVPTPYSWVINELNRTGPACVSAHG
jgi:hypothetical protein